MKILTTLLAAAALQLTLLAPAAAQSNLDAIKAAGVLKIGTEGTYAPFTYHDASGKLVGFDVEIGEAIAEKLGVKAEFLEGKWDGLIAGLDAKRYDVVINQVLVSFGSPAVTHAVIERLQRDGTCWCGGTEWQGRTAMRISVSSWATTDADVDLSLAAMLRIAKECRQGER